MAKLEEIVERVDRRLEELLEESTRLRAALEALGRDDALASRRPRASRTAKPAVTTLGRSDPAQPTGGLAVTLAEPDAVDGNDTPQYPAVERAIRQLREELAAGLRG